MKNIIKIFKILLLCLIASLVCSAANADEDFTQKDRATLIRIEVKMDEIDARFEQLDRRFEQLDKRFEQVDKRFEELRHDMNKRFEQVDKRFEQMMNFLWMLVGIFTTMTMGTIGFAYWDRRTSIRKARDEAIDKIEKEGRLSTLIQALRKLAAEDARLASVLRSFGLL